ncbi:hypothetical protein AVEN_142405-1 [Araneus ventricosus]|uniref:Uncharacterized protein n=1 Tax=Araneus ventricosus TaxID=182803 RepID=A0A4Y2JU43_ARAVE|nr:hypothetical protein AVEN_142405-1 [Araneus ventricosus]
MTVKMLKAMTPGNCQNIQDVRSAASENHRIDIREFSEKCSFEISVHSEDLDTGRMFLPKLLHADHKERLSSAFDLLECAKNKKFLEMIVTADES